jgi:hypothetical protein
MSDSTVANRIPQGLSNRFLTDDFCKSLWTESPRQHRVLSVHEESANRLL